MAAMLERMSDRPADREPPRVTVALPDGRTVPGRIQAWRQGPDGRWWAEVTIHVPAEAVRQIDGEDYAAVPRHPATRPPAAPVGDRSPRALAAAERQRRDQAVPTDDSIRWWKLAPGRPATLHRGDCTTAGTGPTITRSMAIAALTDQLDGQPTAVACGRCRPDIGL
jgi:hypothetical protein